MNQTRSALRYITVISASVLPTLKRQHDGEANSPSARKSNIGRVVPTWWAGATNWPADPFASLRSAKTYKCEDQVQPARGLVPARAEAKRYCGRIQMSSSRLTDEVSVRPPMVRRTR